MIPSKTTPTPPNRAAFFPRDIFFFGFFSPPGAGSVRFGCCPGMGLSGHRLARASAGPAPHGRRPVLGLALGLALGLRRV